MPQKNKLMQLRIFFLLLMLCSVFTVQGRDKDFQDKTYTVYLNFPSYSVRASVLHSNGKIKPREGFTYYWFASNAIQQTENGFDGKLLHGEYKAFYLDNALKEAGEFANGLKTGLWKSWHPNGKLSEETTYAKGRKHGDSKLYSPEGKLIQTAHYKNGKLHGTFTIFEADKKVVTFYKRGNLIEPKAKKVPKDSAATVKSKPEKASADSTAPKKKLFGSKKQKDKTQPAQQPTPEKKPRKPLFRKKTEAEPPKPSSGFNSL